MIVTQLDRNQQVIQHKAQQNQLICCHGQAQIEANLAVRDIVENVERQISQRQFLDKNLLKYSNYKAISNMNEANNLFFQLGFVFGGWPKQQEEPKPLLIDSLLPVSAEIDPQNQYKNKLSTRRMIEDSSQKQRIKIKESSIQKKQKYKKLQYTQVSQEDGFTKELRRIEEDKNQKIEIERKTNEKKEKIRLQKLKDKKKEEIFSYDYNGELIQMKLQSKANLVSKLVNGATKQDINKVKQVFNDPSPTTVEGVTAGKKTIKKIELPSGSGLAKRKDDIEFSQLKSLVDGFKTTYGVKYTHQGKTLEEKKRVVTTMQLKKSLSQRKISKEQYQKLRDLNNNREQLQQKLKKSTIKQSQVKSHRAHSEMKFSQNIIKKARQTIHISNSNLKEKLLEKVAQLQQPVPTQTQQLQLTEGSKFKIGSIDNYNMEYMKAGGSVPSSISRQLNSQKSNTQLPKIMHTTLYSKMKPKGRERLKDANQIFREMRKKFEDKLRI